jgi:transcriptional regulator with XRE-family HTH domain
MMARKSNPEADILKMRRLEARLSQADVASACGMTQGHYSKLERGKIKPGPRASIAFRQWLDGVSDDAGPPSPAVSRGSRLAALARSIERACAEMARVAMEMHSDDKAHRGRSADPPVRGGGRHHDRAGRQD